MDEVPEEGDTDVSKDDGEESTLKSGTDAADGYDTGNLVDMTETDRDNDPDESKDSSRVVANKIGGNRRSRNAFPIRLGQVGPSDVITIWFPMVDREPTLEVQVTKETVLITTKWRVWRVSR